MLKENFIAGDEWLYYKIYTGSNTSEKILQSIEIVTEELLDSSIIDKWFFIRYYDSKYHIRFRMHIVNVSSIGVIINKINQILTPYLAQDLIWKIQLDTYQREVSRYGIDTMILSESLFYNDSKLVIDFLKLIENEDEEDIRWLFALKAIDSIVDSFNYSDQRKTIFFEELKTSFAAEFGMDKKLKRQLDKKYRLKRKKIETFISLKKPLTKNESALLDLLECKRNADFKYIQEILELKKDGKLQVNLDSFLGSHIHMFMNRLFKSKNRLHEMVCYDFLFRYYKSILARKKLNIEK